MIRIYSQNVHNDHALPLCELLSFPIIVHLLYIALREYHPCTYPAQSRSVAWNTAEPCLVITSRALDCWWVQSGLPFLVQGDLGWVLTMGWNRSLL